MGIYRQVEKHSREMTRLYMQVLGNEIRSEYPYVFDICNRSVDNISELYRHSLCLLYGLKSENNVIGVSADAYKRLVSLLKPVADKTGYLTTKTMREGFVQACVTCIVYSAQKVKVYNYGGN